jgi:hypothetical protein
VVHNLDEVIWTPRQRRYLAILKHRRMSRPYKFEIHTRVTGPFPGVGVVDSNRGAASHGEQELCMVRTRASHPKAVGYDENYLKRVSIWRFLLHRNPDGTFQIGNNPLLHWIITMLMYGAFVYGVHGEQGAWQTAVRIIFPAFAVLYLVYTCRQYVGKSK